jgi:hypothetical protein
MDCYKKALEAKKNQTMEKLCFGPSASLKLFTLAIF